MIKLRKVHKTKDYNMANIFKKIGLLILFLGVFSAGIPSVPNASVSADTIRPCSKYGTYRTYYLPTKDSADHMTANRGEGWTKSGCYKISWADRKGNYIEAYLGPVSCPNFYKASGGSYGDQGSCVYDANAECITGPGAYKNNKGNCACKPQYILIATGTKKFCVNRTNQSTTEAKLRKDCNDKGRVWSLGDPRIPDDSYCSKGCTKSDYSYNKSSKKCEKKSEPKQKVDCSKYGRPQDGPYACKRTCTTNGYYLITDEPFDRCVKKSNNPGPGTSPGGGQAPTNCPKGKHKESGKCVPNGNTPNPNNKARKNCEDKLHRIWKNGKCTAKCQDGFQHLKGQDKEKRHKCYPKQDKKDKKKPTVTLTAPANESTANKSIKLSATAKDNVSVKQVNFYKASTKKVDGKIKYTKVASDTSKPYSTTWKTSKEKAGNYYVLAEAVDTNGNVARSERVAVAVDHKGGGTKPPVTGKCDKDYKKNVLASVPVSLAKNGLKMLHGVEYSASCEKVGQVLGLTLKQLGDSEYTAEDIAVYRQTNGSTGSFENVTESISIEDIDDTGKDSSHIEITFNTKDGSKFDLNKTDAKVKGAIVVMAKEEKSPVKPINEENPGSICTDNDDGTKTCTDANGNTYNTGVKDKGAGVLPNTGTSALLGVLAVVAAGVGAVVYQIAKKKGLHLLKDSSPGGFGQ